MTEDVPEHKSIEIPTRLGRLSTIRLRVEVKSRYRSKLSGLAILALTEPEMFFKEKTRYPAKS